ncbi:MAG TPA: M20 family metallopeptidase [Myxococcota bacterium]|nr:M20 family metallopeptidase [Myxococcota bacterium]
MTRDASREREALLRAIDAGAAEALSLARWMSLHPELSLEERETSARYTAYLDARHFEVLRGAAGLETAFVARAGSASAPLCVALLAEMDALPEIGHACGHNLSGPASLLAAHALRAVLSDSDLSLLVVGCPAEEIGAGKRRLVEQGVFERVDAAMMAHASDMRRAHRLFLGNRKLELVYHGRAAHAAVAPEHGRNALDGVIALFVGIGLLRQQLPSGVRVHGIVSDGGKAPNIIPERAAARVWVRALEEPVLEDACARVLACAEGAAAASGTRLESRVEEGSSPSMRPNLPLADCYRRQLVRLGLEETPHAPDESIGSSDITHVSRVVPTIHPNFPIGADLKLHTREFAQATTRPSGEAGMLEAARALALTVLELVREPEVREAVAREAPR